MLQGVATRGSWPTGSPWRHYKWSLSLVFTGGSLYFTIYNFKPIKRSFLLFISSISACGSAMITHTHRVQFTTKRISTFHCCGPQVVVRMLVPGSYQWRQTPNILLKLDPCRPRTFDHRLQTSPQVFALSEISDLPWIYFLPLMSSRYF